MPPFYFVTRVLFFLVTVVTLVTLVYRNFSDHLTNEALELFRIIHCVVPGAQKSMVYKISVVSAGEKITQ